MTDDERYWAAVHAHYGERMALDKLIIANQERILEIAKGGSDVLAAVIDAVNGHLGLPDDD